MEPSEVSVIKQLLADDLGLSWDELDDVLRQTRLMENLEEHVVGEHGVGGGFEDDDVAEHGWRSSEVTGDGGEVEGGDGEDESFERAIF